MLGTPSQSLEGGGVNPRNIAVLGTPSQSLEGGGG